MIKGQLFHALYVTYVSFLLRFMTFTMVTIVTIIKSFTAWLQRFNLLSIDFYMSQSCNFINALKHLHSPCKCRNSSIMISSFKSWNYYVSVIKWEKNQNYLFICICSIWYVHLSHIYECVYLYMYLHSRIEMWAHVCTWTLALKHK